MTSSGGPPDLTASLGAVAQSLDQAQDGGEGLVLDLGQGHPSMHGALRLRLWLDGDRIAACEPEIGFMHRGAEKLYEVRDYRQIIMLANRHDWLSAFANELGVVLAVERMLGIEVPVRAVWLRTLLAELNRVLHHLMFVGAYPAELGTPPRTALHQRESLIAVMEELTGGRMHYMFNRIGGLKEDLPQGWLGRAATATGDVRRLLPHLVEATRGNDTFVRRTQGVGVLDRQVAVQHGVSGPVARACGLAVDLRRDEPYLAYAEMQDLLRIPTREQGDALARFDVLVEEIGVGLDLATACIEQLQRLPRGPINVRLPKIVKAPEGATYAWTESPGGVNGYYLVSRGEKTPWRMKLRTPGFNNASALGHVVTGSRVADLVPILASLFFVVGDIDK